MSHVRGSVSCVAVATEVSKAASKLGPTSRGRWVASMHHSDDAEQSREGGARATIERGAVFLRSGVQFSDGASRRW